MSNLSTRARRRIKSRSPVRDNVRANWDRIKEAIDDGVSRAAIHAELTAEGIFVGNHPSGLNQAIRRVLADIVAGREPMLQQPVSVPHFKPIADVKPIPEPAKWSSRGFDDDRVAPTWGGDQ